MKRQLEKRSNDSKKLGIWKRVGHSQWSAGTSIQPKKTGDVRALTDFRKLNEYLQLVRKPHPLPKINELFYKSSRDSNGQQLLT